MRVIAGKYKRKPLQTQIGNDITRPTTDRIKENLFNILSPELPNAIVLDLFSGSGALGIEALSRGAKKVYFVEKNPLSYSIIKNNLKNIGVPTENFVLVHSDVSAFLKNYNCSEKFDIIFADPPYASHWYATALNEINSSGAANKICTVIFEMAKVAQYSVNCNSEAWMKQDERHYGKTKLEFWIKREVV